MQLKTSLLALAALACAGAATLAPAVASADPYDHGQGRFEHQQDHRDYRGGHRGEFHGEYRAHRYSYAHRHGYAHRYAYGYRHFHYHVRDDYRR